MDIEEYYDKIIYLSDKQLEAKERMEKNLERTPRNGFFSYEEFNEYMEFLIKQIKRKINLSKAVKSGKVSYQEINDKRKAKIIKYYNQPAKLKNYGLKYYQKYYPSNAKLKEKLIEKSKNEELSNEILESFLKDKLIYTDIELANNYTQRLLSQGKNFTKIKIYLYNKKFPKEIISEIIDKIKEEGKSLLNYESTYRKMKRLYQAGKSEFEIKRKIVETPEDQELFNEILENIKEEGFDDIENVNIQEIRDIKIEKIIENLIIKGNDKNKIINKMFQKGYKYDDIKLFLENIK